MYSVDFLGRYGIEWKDVTTKSFVGILYHYVKHSEGDGTLNTPIGLVVGYTEYTSEFHLIKVIIKDCVSYNSINNTIELIVYSRYRYKVVYYLKKIRNGIFTTRKLHIGFEDALAKALTNNGVCKEPFDIEIYNEKLENRASYGEFYYESE